jgi:hypothetical protein
MQEVVSIAPLRAEPGLIAYECPACGHVTSEILPARQGEANQGGPVGRKFEAMPTFRERSDD